MTHTDDLPGTRVLRDVHDLTPEARRLADLLPAMLLTVDAEDPDRPLLRLLEVLAGPLATLGEAVGRLERDPFVARGSVEALPLIAELVGARLLGDDGPTNRRVVAGTVPWRRRKGTLPTLEDVLTRTTGWPAEVDEGFRSLLVTQDVTEPLPSRGWTALLWDPIAVADPLTRRAHHPPRHPSAALDAPRTGDDVTETLRRLGAPDALLLAASPRTVDLDGWARPDGVSVRTTRVAVAERDEVVLGAPLVLVPAGGGPPPLGLRLDPGGADGPVAARVVGERVPADLGWTEVHEPPPAAPAPRRPELLTPTDLAADPLAVAEGDALRLAVDGVLVVGQEAGAGARHPLAYEPPGPDPVLRFAHGDRPGPQETWRLELAAVDLEATVAQTLASGTPGDGLADTNPVVLRAEVSRAAATVEVTPAGASARSGASLALRLERTAGHSSAWRRAPDGTWTAQPLIRHPGEAVSDAVLATVGGTATVVRLVRVPVDGAPDALVLAAHVPGAATWTLTPLDVDAVDAEDRPGTVWLDPGPAALLVPAADDVLLVGPDVEGSTRAWRLTDLDQPAVGVVPLDVGAAVLPGPREAAAACLVGDVLSLHGGQRGTVVLDDLWQLPLAGPHAGRWVQRRVRDRVARSGGLLLGTDGGLLRVGGADESARLCPTVSLVDLGAARPRWATLPELPLPAPDGPGTLWARHDATGTHAVVWADRLRARTMDLAPGARTWSVGPFEASSPNPPAEGEMVTVGDDVLVVGAPPLPPSEAVVTLGGRGHLAFLPAVDPVTGAPDVVLLDSDGSTRTWFPAGTPAAVRLRLGRNREPGVSRGRDAPTTPRVGAAGRWAWAPLEVRQASLGPWDQPVALALADVVALDPRLGRVAVSSALGGVRPAGSVPRFSASYHVARGTALGAGFVPPGELLPARWQEPEDLEDPGRWDLPDPPHLRGPTGVRPEPVAVVGPPGRVVATGGTVLPRLDTALSVALGVADGPASVAVVGSPRLAPATAAVREGRTTSVHAWDRTGYPFVTADDDGVSLTLLERAPDGGRSDVGPHVMLTGLAFEGTVEIATTSGAADLRWCDLGLARGGVGVRVAGAGHHTALLRATPAEPSFVLRLHGCVISRLEVPAWVQVVAAGCTFDAGDRTTPALMAPGAHLRLRECTVRGAVEAGVLEATACVLAGRLSCDRPDLGWLRRCVTVPEPDRRPRSWAGVTADVSFAEGRPTWPRYLVLDDNNPTAVLTAGEGGRPPGAHADRGRSALELARRTDDFLPLGLAAHHSDRAADDVHRMGRSLT